SDLRYARRLQVFFASDAAELLVVDEFRYRPVIAANGATRVLAQLEFAELHSESIKEQQPSDERVAAAQDQLDDLHGLQATDDARQYPQDAALGATGNQSRRGRLGIEAAIAGAVLCVENRDLSLEAEDAAVNVRLPKQHAGIVDQVARGEVVCAIGYDVVVAEDFQRVLRAEACFVAFHLDKRIDFPKCLPRRVQLRPAHVVRPMDDLPLQVGKVHNVEVHDAELSHPGCSQVERQRRAESPGPDAQHPGLLQLELALHAHLGHDEMTTVTEDFIPRQLCRRINCHCGHGHSLENLIPPRLAASLKGDISSPAWQVSNQVAMGCDARVPRPVFGGRVPGLIT